MAKRKKRKALLPKRIAGVKVPKSVRKGRLGELLASQTGQALLAEAVLAAGAIGAAKTVGGGAANKPPSVRSFANGVAGRLASGHDGGRDAAAAGAALARAFGEAARAFVNSLNDHATPQPDADAVEAEWRARDAEDSKKKPSFSPPPSG